MTQSPTDRRKVVCRVLTNVLLESQLGQRFNSQAFYMLLSANFATLMTRDGFDLRPIWVSLQAQVGDDPCLPGLLVAFQEHLTKQGLESIVPPGIAEMPLLARSQAVSRAFSSSDSEEAVILEIPVGDISFNTDEIPALESHELIPLAPLPASDPHLQRHEIIHHITHGLKKTSVAKHLDFSQLAFRLNEHLDELFDTPQNLNLTPLLRNLEHLEGYSPRGIFVGFIHIQEQLSSLGINLIIPDLGISTQEGTQLLREARVQERSEQQRSIQESPAGSAANITPPPDHQPRKKNNTLRHKLIWKNLRVVILVTVFISLGAAAWFMQPDQSLNPTGYNLPLEVAELRSGIFVGTLNEELWYTLSLKQREAHVKAFEATLRSRGYAKNAVVLDSKGRLVMRAQNTGHIQASKFVLESPNGITAPLKKSPKPLPNVLSP